MVYRLESEPEACSSVPVDAQVFRMYVTANTGAGRTQTTIGATALWPAFR